MKRNDTHEGVFASSPVRRLGLFTIVAALACASLFPASAQKNRGARALESAPTQTHDGPQYTTLYYRSGGLNIEAYFYKPQGAGPFPLVIYNHGSRAGHEREEKPFQFIAAVLVPQGYAVLVPERRGYGKSDGQTYDEEVQNDRGERMMTRFHEEAGDVLAALDYLKQHEHEALADADRPRPTPAAPQVDLRRVALMGWSHGGVVSLLAASERHEFVALVDQAGGALTWKSSPVLRAQLPAAAAQIKVPALCMDSENDATTDAAKTVGEAIKNSGEPEQTIIYPPFTPTSNPSNVAPGHLIFAQGVSIWQNDLLTFLKPYLTATPEKLTPDRPSNRRALRKP